MCIHQSLLKYTAVTKSPLALPYPTLCVRQITHWLVVSWLDPIPCILSFWVQTESTVPTVAIFTMETQKAWPVTPASPCETWQETQLSWGQGGRKLHPAVTLTENSQPLQGHPSAVGILNTESGTELGKTLNPIVRYDSSPTCCQLLSVARQERGPALHPCGRCLRETVIKLEVPGFGSWLHHCGVG